MNKVTRSVLTTLCLGTLIVTGYAVAEQMKATPGYFIKNNNPGTVTTANTAGCSGITFPGSITSGTSGTVQVPFPNSAQSPCHTTYTSQETGTSCLVTVVAGGGVAKLYGSPKAACYSTGGHSGVVIGSGS